MARIGPVGWMPDHLDQQLGVDADPSGLGDQWIDVLLGELLAPQADQPVPGAGDDEHADPPALFQDPVVNQQVDALGRRRRIDPVERRELVGRRHPVTLGQRAVHDVGDQLVGDLQEER